MGGGENPTYTLIFSKMFLFLFMIFFYIDMHIHGVKKVGWALNVQEIWMNSNSNEIARFRKLDCCSDLYIL